MNSASQCAHSAQPSTGTRAGRQLGGVGQLGRSSHPLPETQGKARCPRRVGTGPWGLREQPTKSGDVVADPR
jgi:hypothetical protein